MTIAPSQATLLAQAAAAAAGHQQYPAGTLYLVATPIGNLADITLRTLHLLALADAVACEDTRVTGQLLRGLGLDKPLLSLHQHNERAAAAAIVERLARGQRVAYASDAGTPAISDPGALLVATVAAAGHRVMPLPGPSSVVCALSAAGDALGQGFHFAGFLPAKGRERERALQQVLGSADTQVLFEAPHRIAALLQALAAAAPQRRLTVCRELTKQFETIHTAAAGDLPVWLAADAQRGRGEFVLVLHALPAPADDGAQALPAEARRSLGLLLRELPLKQAAALAAELHGLPRKALYQHALALRGAEPVADEADGAEAADAADGADPSADDAHRAGTPQDPPADAR